MGEKYFFDKFILRTPLLSLNAIREIFSDFTLLNKYITDSDFKSALYISSPAFYDELQRIITPISEYDSRVIQTLFKYVSRSSYRCTPYGLFANIGIGTISDNPTNIIIDNQLHLKARFDMDYLCALYYLYMNDKEFIKKLKFYPNNSLYKFSKKWHFIKFNSTEGRRLHYLDSVANNAIISKIIKASEYGISYADLHRLIILRGYSELVADSYIQQLIGAQILYAEIYPHVTGLSYQETLLSAISFEYSNDASNWNEMELSDTVPLVRGITNKLEQTFPIKIKQGKTIQVDALRKIENSSVNKNILDEIMDAAGILLKLASKDIGKSNLEQFKKAFLERYETAEVPLQVVLDPDVGIDYKNLGNDQDYQNKSKFIWNKASKFKLDLFVKSVSEGLYKIDVNNLDIQITHSNLKLPRTLCFFGSLLNEGSGQTIVWKNLSGPNFLALVGRFAYMDKELENFCYKMANEEERIYSDKIFAEISHLPSDRAGNVVSRPHLRKYEIPFLANSTLPIKNQIQINDLMLSVKNNRFFLRSKRLNKQVIPRLSNAHNYNTSNLSIYTFLCDLQFEGINSNTHWEWAFLSTEVFLPRVTYKNIILSPAMWNIKIELFKDILKSNLRYELFEKLRENLKIRQLVLLGENDNQLLLDLKQPLCVDVLLANVERKNSGYIRLIEAIGVDGNKAVKDTEENFYNNEIIIPFSINVNRSQLLKQNKTHLEPFAANRMFPPYSEWLYFKIYCGQQSSDRILTEEIYMLCKRLSRLGYIKKWFFLRYKDPKFHIRLRFFLDKKFEISLLYKEIEKKFHPLIKTGQIWRLQTDTYYRELERYGGSGNIEFSESFFYMNSLCVCDLLKLEDREEWKKKYKFIIALLGVHSIYDGLSYSLNEKLRSIKRALDSDTINAYMNQNDLFRQTVKDNFRRDKEYLEYTFFGNLECAVSDQPFFKLVNGIFNKHVKEIKNLLLKNELSPEQIEQLIHSYIHMFINRYFSTAHLQLEISIYNYLFKIYSSISAREKYRSVL